MLENLRNVLFRRIFTACRKRQQKNGPMTYGIWQSIIMICRRHPRQPRQKKLLRMMIIFSNRGKNPKLSWKVKELYSGERVPLFYSGSSGDCDSFHLRQQQAVRERRICILELDVPGIPWLHFLKDNSRSTAISLLINKGVPESVTQELANHADPRITTRYYRQIDDVRKKEALAKIDIFCLFFIIFSIFKLKIEKRGEKCAECLMSLSISYRK